MSIWPSLQWLKCFSQPWEGDVTIVLPSSFMQIKKSITNPTSDDLLEASQQVRPHCFSESSSLRIVNQVTHQYPSSRAFPNAHLYLQILALMFEGANLLNTLTAHLSKNCWGICAYLAAVVLILLLLSTQLFMWSWPVRFQNYVLAFRVREGLGRSSQPFVQIAASS